MFEPRIIYACNHYIVESFIEAAVLPVTEIGDSQEDSVYSRKDQLIPNSLFKKNGTITITSAECIEASEVIDEILQFSVNCKTYYLGEHFNITYEMKAEAEEFKQYVYINWLKDTVPEPPKLYSAEIQYVRVISKLYDETDCPRCSGDGWYAGIFESGNINPSKVTDKNKLVQTFLKYMYTRKTDKGYGTRMLEIPGKYDLTDKEFINNIIRDEIMSFKDFYTNKTSSMLVKGYSFTNGEILKAMSVSDVEIDTENMRIKTTVTFLTADSGRSSVDLMITNL